MDWPSQNWVWIAVAIFFFLMMRKGGMGCGMGHAGHGADKSSPADAGKGGPDAKKTAQEHKHRGCC